MFIIMNGNANSIHKKPFLLYEHIIGHVKVGTPRRKLNEEVFA